MGQRFEFGDAAACVIVFFAFLGMVWMAQLLWRCIRRKPPEGRYYVIGPNGDIRSVPGTGAVGELLRAIERHQTN